MRSTRKNKEFDKRTAPPETDDARENMLISLAMDRAEEQLRNGTASAQVIVHYLRLGTQKEKLERQQLEERNALLKAKADSIKSVDQMAKRYDEAIEAFKRYGGHGSDEEDEDDYYDE